MNPLSLVIHADARDEYAAAYAWYEERNPGAALRFAAAIEKALRLIPQTPELWGKIDDEHRRCVVKGFPYAIIYLVHEELVHVIAFAHSRRRADYWQQRSIEDA